MLKVLHVSNLKLIYNFIVLRDYATYIKIYIQIINEKNLNLK